MSAIFGLLIRDGTAGDAALLQRMNAALAGEGGDGDRTWAAGPVGLGHRLACFTCEDRLEHQPLIAFGDQLALVVDGRVDNRIELTRTLEIPPEQARRLPDSAFVLRAYVRWGGDCLDRLVGEFAFVLWDGRREVLVAASSAPTARPLYYHATPFAFAFSSRPRGLFALPFVPRRIDEERVAGLLGIVSTSRQRSFYRDVERLAPGQLLVAGCAGQKVQEWWQPDLPGEPQPGDGEQRLAWFEELFERVIADHLRAEGRVGIMMSGGLDSGSVAAMSAPLLGAAGDRLAAYTEVPPAGFGGPVQRGRYADETPIVRAIAGIYPNIDVNLVDAGDSGLLETADRFFASAEIPFRNACNRPWIEAIYERASSSGVRVLLNGDQGNLTVSWDGRGLLPELLRRGQLARALREARAVARAGREGSAWRVMLGQGARPLLPVAVERAVTRWREEPDARSGSAWAAYSLIHPDFAAEHRLDERIAAGTARSYNRLVARDSPAARLRTLRATSIMSADLQAGYRSLFGIDTRSPLADRRIVEFCLALPEEDYAGGGETRLLIRRAMAARLPHQTIHGRTRGLQAADWFDRMRAERHRLLDDVTRFEQNDLTSRVLDLPRLRRLLERLPADVPTESRAVGLYRGAVGMALITGRFLLWCDAGAPAGTRSTPPESKR